jgi:hypothetical protein
MPIADTATPLHQSGDLLSKFRKSGYPSRSFSTPRTLRQSKSPRTRSGSLETARGMLASLRIIAGRHAIGEAAVCNRQHGSSATAIQLQCQLRPIFNPGGGRRHPQTAAPCECIVRPATVQARPSGPSLAGGRSFSVMFVPCALFCGSRLSSWVVHDLWLVVTRPCASECLLHILTGKHWSIGPR